MTPRLTVGVTTRDRAESLNACLRIARGDSEPVFRNSNDPRGWLWIGRELLRSSKSVASGRRPVCRATLETWRKLKASPIPYSPPLAASRGDDAA